MQGGRQELLPIEEFAGKIEAAKAAQKNPDFMVMARIEALIAGHGQDEAQMRARRYAEAGADAIFIHSKSSSPEEVITFDKNWDLDVPLILTPTNYFTLRETDIKQMKNVKMVIYANHCLRASIKAMENILAKIKNDGGIYDINDSIATVPHIFELQGVPQMKEKEKKYLR